VCLYVTTSYDEGLPMLVHAAPDATDAASDFYQLPYSIAIGGTTGAGYIAPENRVPNGMYTENPYGGFEGTPQNKDVHPSDNRVGYNYKTLKSIYTDEQFPVGPDHDCLDTCGHASDGACDDGGNGAEFSTCALGTDCEDCGDRPKVPHGMYQGVKYVMTPVNTHAPDYVSWAASEGHNIGLGWCHWIGHCSNAADMVGTPCKAYKHGQPTTTYVGGISTNPIIGAPNTVEYDGFCFESSTGSLECGHLAATADRFGQGTNVLDAPLLGSHPTTHYRCPRKAPVISGGGDRGMYQVHRLLVAGCMISTDNEYNSLAEVHVPAMCSVPTDLKKGCMLPRAVNYDMTAVQSGPCTFHTAGCTDSTAHNFNPEADTNDGSCIPIIKGCTVKDQRYSHVANSDTPKYDSSFVGVPLRGVGEVLLVDHTASSLNAMINYDATANYLEGCVPAVEGCMDSLAANYDPFANINSQTWCVPVVRGCMMPQMDYASLAYQDGFSTTDPTTGKIYAIWKDGLAANYDPTATVDTGKTAYVGDGGSVDACIVYRLGCMNNTAVNYDPYATVADFCYFGTEGCLHPDAINHQCKNRPDHSTDPQSGCSHESGGYVTTYDNRHNNVGKCQFFANPPPPPQPPGAGAIKQVVVSLSLSSDVATATAVQAETQAAIQSSSGTAVATEVVTTIVAGSATVTTTQTFASEADQDSASTGLTTNFGTSEAANAYLATQNLNLGVLSTTVFKQNIAPAGDDDNTAVVVGASVGGVFGFLLIVGAAIMIKRKQSKVEA
jgi:hypothetical protein